MNPHRIRQIAQIGGDGDLDAFGAKENPTGSAASCGMLKLVTSISPMVKLAPA